VMDEEVAGLLLHVGDAGAPALPGDLALVARLAAALGIEGRAVEYRLHLGAGDRAVDLAAVLDQGQELAGDLDLLVAHELGGAEPVADGEPLAGRGHL